MGEESGVGPCVRSGHAVVIPVDLDQDVRVIDWPGRDALSTLYREIGCQVVDVRIAGDLGFWTDDEGAMGEGWAANGRATWLACVATGQALLVAGTVVVTLSEPDHDGDNQGVTGELAERIATIARAVPEHDPARLTAQLQEVVAHGISVIVLGENGASDQFAV